MEYIFENAEKMPNDFYINIMNLVKNFHEHGNNFYEIHTFLEFNKNKIEDSILKQIKSYIKLKKMRWSCLIEYINCKCCFCLIVLSVLLFFIVFLGFLVWCLIKK